MHAFTHTFTCACVSAVESKKKASTFSNNKFLQNDAKALARSEKTTSTEHVIFQDLKNLFMSGGYLRQEYVASSFAAIFVAMPNERGIPISKEKLHKAYVNIYKHMHAHGYI